MLSLISNHVEVAEDRLLEQYKNSPNLKGLLAGIVTPLQDLENQNFLVYVNRHIHTAAGAQLDGIGEIVGELRQGANDASYRRAIQARIAINNGGGEPESIIAAIRAMMDPIKITYGPLYPASFQINIKIKDFDPDFIPIIRTLSPAGVGEIIITTSSEGEPFVFSEIVEGQAAVGASSTETIATEDNPSFDFILGTTTFVPVNPDEGLGFGEVIVTPIFLDIGGGESLDLGDGSTLSIIDGTNHEDYEVVGGGEFAEIRI